MVRNDMVNYGHRYSAEEYALSPEMTLGLDPREITIGDVLHRAGYRTGVVGKWDMGQAKRYLPLQRGFDFFYGHGNNGIDYYTHERYGVPSLFAGNARTEAGGLTTRLSPPKPNRPSQNVTEYEKTIRESSSAVTPHRV